MEYPNSFLEISIMKTPFGAKLRLLYDGLIIVDTKDQLDAAKRLLDVLTKTPNNYIFKESFAENLVIRWNISSYSILEVSKLQFVIELESLFRKEGDMTLFFQLMSTLK